MRGDDRQPSSMFSYVSAEARVPADHPLQPIRTLVDEILARDVAGVGRTVRPRRWSVDFARAPSAGSLLQLFYSTRSERLLMAQLDYNIPIRWFVGLEMDEPIQVPTVFTKKRDRLLNQEVARQFLAHVIERAAAWMSDLPDFFGPIFTGD